jgi:hypothetical protein
MNEKQIILAFTKSRFDTQLCAGAIAKSKGYLAN